MTYSEPYPSYTSTAATFIGGAFVGGIIGYAIGDDDNDMNVHVDRDWNGGYGGGRRDVNVSGNTVNVVGNNNRRASSTDIQTQLRECSGTTAVPRNRQSVSATALAPAKRPAISAVPGAVSKPIASSTSSGALARTGAPRSGGLGDVTSVRQTKQATARAERSRAIGKPSGGNAKTMRASAGSRPGAKVGNRASGSAFSGVTRGSHDRTAGKRGGSSRKGRGGGGRRG